MELLPSTYLRPEKLDIIEADHCHDTVRCMKVLEIWLETSSDATWNQLIRALRSPSVQLYDLADQLERMIIKEGVI